MKVFALVLAGFVLGVSLTAAVLGRYSLVVGEAGPSSSMRDSVAYRLDKWTGRVTIAETNPYLDP